MYCIVGLGNPGEEYARTRHNVGFRVVEELANSKDTHIRRPEYRALTATVMLGRTEVLVMKPQTYMNRSGESVAAALADKGLAPSDLLVIYDDVDLPLGRVRMRRGGGSGGHNGVQSIIDAVGDATFARLRLGVGRPDANTDLIEHVLSEFASDESAGVAMAIKRGARAVEVFVAEGLTSAMQKFNGLAAADVEEDAKQ